MKNVTQLKTDRPSERQSDESSGDATIRAVRDILLGDSFQEHNTSLAGLETQLAASTSEIRVLQGKLGEQDREIATLKAALKHLQGERTHGDAELNAQKASAVAAFSELQEQYARDMAAHREQTESRIAQQNSMIARALQSVAEQLTNGCE